MRILSIILTILLLAACASANIKEHQDTLPLLKLEQFFDGKLKAYGMVLDRSGNLLRRFEVDLLADWQGDNGQIKEWFRFDDGEKSTRIWQLTRTGEHQYQGQAGDVIGIAKGETRGSALYWQYDMDIKVGDDTYKITLDDWMFLIDEKRLFNKTDMTKLGFKVGEIILYIEKL